MSVVGRNTTSAENAQCLNFLFKFAIPSDLTILRCCRAEKIIHICLQGVDHPGFLFELCTFVIKPLLLVEKPLLFCLEYLQTRQLFIALHGKQRTPRRLKDHKFGFMLCLEARLVFRLLEGVIYGF